MEFLIIGGMLFVIWAVERGGRKAREGIDSLDPDKGLRDQIRNERIAEVDARDNDPNVENSAEDQKDKAAIRAQIEADNRARAARTRIPSSGYEVIKVDGKIGYYKDGSFVEVTPGVRMQGPSGRWGTYLANGDFIPEVDAEGNA